VWETKGHGQPLGSGLRGQDTGKRPATGWGAQEVPHQYVKELLHSEGDGALEQAAQRSWAVSFSGEIQDPPGHLPAVPPAGGSLLWQGVGLDDLQRAIPTPVIRSAFLLGHAGSQPSLRPGLPICTCCLLATQPPVSSRSLVKAEKNQHQTVSPSRKGISRCKHKILGEGPQTPVLQTVCVC